MKKTEGLASPKPSPPRKVYFYSQQLPGPSSNEKKQHQPRKHSLEGIPGAIRASHHDHHHSYESSCVDADLRQCRPLAEFLAGDGHAGIFKPPIRAAVHPGRPPCLELRLHPLRETQVGKFLRNIVCTDTQLWAGQESGVRFWNLENAYDAGCGLGGGVRRGDEDAAPFQESVNTSPTMCLMIDCGNRLVWSGHKDGKIRSWKMDQQQSLPLNNDRHALSNNNNNENNAPFKEGLSWQAHKGPVISMVMSSSGDLWSGAEGGVIKVFPWETIEKSVSLSSEEKHMAAQLVERSHIDLRAQVTVNGQCSISSSDVKCLLSDDIRAKVWDARTKELLKVFNLDGQIENRVDLSAGKLQDQTIEDEMKVKFVPTSKKEKPQGFLQRSRNAIMGAAGAVRRVATRGAGAFVEDTRRTEALVLTIDGMIWSGCTNGRLVQWDGNGNPLQDFTHHSCAVQCFCIFGTRIYVGYVSGTIQVLDLDGNVVATWVAHNNPVLKLAAGNGYIFSLAAHGGIRGWSVMSPGPLDNTLRMELAEKDLAYTRRHCLRIPIGTWNVGQGRASHDALMSWLGPDISDVGIVVAGLQEVEMGAGFLAVSAAKETGKKEPQTPCWRC